MGYTGPLADKDRIFTNVYGFQEPWLKAARARGDWDDAEDLNLTVEQVTRRFERRLAVSGNNRVKLGTVAEKDGTITVDIVTTDKGGLVQRLGIDRKTGLMRPIDG